MKFCTDTVRFYFVVLDCIFRFIRYLRVATEKDLTYFTGSVWAEMKKNVSYRVDFSYDHNGIIQEAQCECPVGQGPTAHCKHVVCTMLGVHVFSETNEVLTEQTCTQVMSAGVGNCNVYTQYIYIYKSHNVNDTC